jgi:hypothetical protein
MGEVEITDAMMGTPQQQLGTINDLLSDRSLEAKFQFEEPDEPLPDLVELAKTKSYGRGESNASEGSKRAQQAARKAAAMAAADIQEQEAGIFSILKAKLSQDKDGEPLTPVKVGFPHFLQTHNDAAFPPLASSTLSLTHTHSALRFCRVVTRTGNMGVHLCSCCLGSLLELSVFRESCPNGPSSVFDPASIVRFGTSMVGYHHVIS